MALFEFDDGQEHEFLKVYEIRDAKMKLGSDVNRAFFQMDVWDYHIFRLFRYENTWCVEMENIPKDSKTQHFTLEELLEKMRWDCEDSEEYATLEDALEDIEG
jgi:hypothetical protein